MNKILAFMLLDFRSMPIFTRIAIPLFLLFVTLNHPFRTSLVMSVFVGFMSAVAIMQSFIDAEKNRLETLHATLPITRGDIVKARYLFFVCIQVAVLLLLLLRKLLFFPNNEMSNFFIVAATAFLTASFIIAVFYPLLFKVGYRKAAILVSPPVIILVFLLLSGALPGFLAPGAQLTSATSLGNAAAGLILLCLSYLLSLKIYRTRDL